MDTNSDYFVPDKPASPWAGADNMNHFFTQRNCSTRAKPHWALLEPINFTSRLLAAGNGVSTYDRYTFYRLLSQLGTDTTPESGKMNLNYDNLDPYINGVAASTNFMAWTPLAFFTNAADRLLRAYTTQWRNGNPTNFATTFYTVATYNFTNINQRGPMDQLSRVWHRAGIPVLVSNQFVYSPAVNRLLQLAANMYDATTTTFLSAHFPPSLFTGCQRFGVAGLGTNVYITGYALQTLYIVQGNETNSPDLALPIDASDLAMTNIARYQPGCKCLWCAVDHWREEGLPEFQ